MIDSILGSAGNIQLLVDHPIGMPLGVAMVGHPQPLLGGGPRHIVPHSVARRVVDEGWMAVRPSFRGVDGSEGRYSDGIGEADDAVAIATHLRQQYPSLPLALIGFSFGAYVYARAACTLERTAPVEALILLGLPVGPTPAGRTYEPLPIPARSLLLHGQDDALAPLSQLLAWRRSTHQPVLVFPGTDHFFKGCLSDVLGHIGNHLRGFTRSASIERGGRPPPA
jgi:alpha/beta superfamily hydrolase